MIFVKADIEYWVSPKHESFSAQHHLDQHLLAHNFKTRPKDTRLVWDLPVRVMHWLLVPAVITTWVTGEAQGDWFPIHVVCGYITLVIVLTRVVWGFVGTRHACFVHFVRAPRAIAIYTKKMLLGTAENTVGHNPLGAVMVLLLLSLLLAQALTGLFSNDQVSDVGPLSVMSVFTRASASPLFTGFWQR